MGRTSTKPLSSLFRISRSNQSLSDPSPTFPSPSMLRTSALDNIDFLSFFRTTAEMLIAHFACARRTNHFRRETACDDFFAQHQTANAAPHEQKWCPFKQLLAWTLGKQRKNTGVSEAIQHCAWRSKRRTAPNLGYATARRLRREGATATSFRSERLLSLRAAKRHATRSLSSERPRVVGSPNARTGGWPVSSS